MNINYRTAHSIRVLAGLLAFFGAANAMGQPTITVHPQDRFVDRGVTALFTLSVAAAQSTSCQWFFEGQELAGGTNFTLRLTNAQPEQTGQYFAVASDVSGATTSKVARLKVFLPAVHGFREIVSSSDGLVTFKIAGETSALFRQYYDLHPVEVSSNLTNWAPLVTLVRTNADLSPMTFVDAARSPHAQFYRTSTNLLITPLPKLTGPFSVGTFSMLLTDPRRMNAVRRTNVQFMVTFWYPALPEAGALPAPYAERPLALGSIYSGFASRVPQFFAHSISNAVMATHKARYPILLYSMAGGGTRRENTAQTEELASWGYVVVAIDHKDAPISVFPDGKVVAGSLDTSSVAAIARQLDDRVLDAKLVMDELARLNAEHLILRGRLDLDRIGAFGWSLGGATAAELSRVDTRCKATAGMDGGFFKTNLLREAYTAPFLFFRASGPDPAVAGDDRFAVYNAHTTNAYWVKLTNVVHWSFCEQSLIWDPATFQSQFGAPPPDRQTSGIRVCQIVRAYLRSFFDKHLLGRNDHLLDAPSLEYPEVSQFLKK